MGKWRKINVTSSLVSVIETKPNFHISHGYTTSINHFWAIHIVRYVSKWTFGRYEIQTLVAKIVVKITYIWRQYHQREASTIFHVRSAPPPFTPIFNVGLIFLMLKVHGHHHISCWSDFFDAESHRTPSYFNIESGGQGVRIILRWSSRLWR